jgi:hypothetical protein
VTRHGHKRRGLASATYVCWENMLKRCRNPSSARYARYGARGIAVCDEWHSFEAFLADMGEKPSGMTLERKDVNAGYNKNNCEWADATAQANNRSNNRIIEWRGVKMTAARLAASVGIDYGVLRKRLNREWSVERAITQPVRRS